MMETMNPYLDYYSTHRVTGPVESHKTAEKIEQFLSVLNVRGRISLTQLRILTFHGIPNVCKGLRALVWKVLLGYLPTDVFLWSQVHSTLQVQYEEFKEEFYQQRKFISFNETLFDSRDYNAAFNSDFLLWQDIRKDIDRTCPDLQFFFLPKDLKPECEVHSRLWMGKTTPDNPGEFDNASDFSQSMVVTRGIERHADIMMRILFIYAKLNPGIKYVQGMNEILAPLYYLFAHDPNPLFSASLEADTFFCFTLLMSEIKDMFVRHLDETNLGVQARIGNIYTMLETHDFQLWTHLENQGVSPNYFCLRWVTLLLTQDFSMPEVMRLWDALFADPHRFEFFDYICVSMIMTSRNKVLGTGFATTLKELQKKGNKNLDEVLSIASVLMTSDHKVAF